jgi:hypothetical protein
MANPTTSANTTPPVAVALAHIQQPVPAPDRSDL